MTFVILGFALMALTTIPPLLKKEYRRELVVFCILYILGFVSCILYTADVELTSPLILIKNLLESIHFHF